MKLVVGLSVLVALWFMAPQTQAKSPILLFHGIVGSTLNARDNRQREFFDLFDTPHECNTGGDFRRLWVGSRLLKCGIYELSLQYDARRNQFSDMPDVTVEVPGFGETSSVEALDSLGLIRYLGNFVDYFVERGYQRGQSIRAAPYDWRLAADELERRGYYDRVKSLVEEMYRQNGNEKVTLVIHSMGGPVSLHFLTGYSGINQAWKDRYLNAYVTLAGAWSGGVSALGSVISGKQFGGFDLAAGLLADFLIPIIQTLQSIPWLIPRSSVFGNEVLVSTPSRDYTAADYQELFDRIGYTNGFTIHNDLIKNIIPNFPAPNVPTFCYYGVDVPTPTRYIYTHELQPGTVGDQPDMVINGDGDGTVNRISSEVCQRWRGMRQGFMHREYEGAGHNGIVSDPRVLNDIALIVGASPPSSTFSRA